MKVVEDLAWQYLGRPEVVRVGWKQRIIAVLQEMILPRVGRRPGQRRVYGRSRVVVETAV
jgi:hypothetical protein